MNLRRKRWFRAIALFTVVLVSVLSIADASYQAIASRADAQRFSHPGRLVSAGEVWLNIYCTGAGSPTACWTLDSLATWSRRRQGEISEPISAARRWCLPFRHTLILSRTEDRARLASDPSADPEAGMAERARFLRLSPNIPAAKR